MKMNSVERMKIENVLYKTYTCIRSFIAIVVLH